VRDNPFTLLPHFVGHYSILLDGVKTTFVVMQNVFATPNKIHEKFDLKGSTVDRFAKPEERKKLTSTKKDLDIHHPILLGPKRKEILLEQMQKDCELLRKCDIMDYSFLVGIHTFTEAKKPSTSSGNPAPSGGPRQGSSSPPPQPHTSESAVNPREPIAAVSSKHETTTTTTGKSIKFADSEDGGRESVGLNLSQKYDGGALAKSSTLVSETYEVSEGEDYDDDDDSDRNNEVHGDQERKAIPRMVTSTATSVTSQPKPKSAMKEPMTRDQNHELHPSFSAAAISTVPAGVGGMVFDDGRCFTADQGGMQAWDPRVNVTSQPREIYYIGIIDILQEYNWWKRSETFVKSFTHDVHQVSSVDPTEYANRFVSFMSNLLV
jgi:hypothetical protein